MQEHGVGGGGGESVAWQKEEQPRTSRHEGQGGAEVSRCVQQVGACRAWCVQSRRRAGLMVVLNGQAPGRRSGLGRP